MQVQANATILAGGRDVSMSNRWRWGDRRRRRWGELRRCAAKRARSNFFHAESSALHVILAEYREFAGYLRHVTSFPFVFFRGSDHSRSFPCTFIDRIRVYHIYNNTIPLAVAASRFEASMSAWSMPQCWDYRQRSMSTLESADPPYEVPTIVWAIALGCGIWYFFIILVQAIGTTQL